jgi:hypothetical protein
VHEAGRLEQLVADGNLRRDLAVGHRGDGEAVEGVEAAIRLPRQLYRVVHVGAL